MEEIAAAGAEVWRRAKCRMAELEPECPQTRDVSVQTRREAVLTVLRGQRRWGGELQIAAGSTAHAEVAAIAAQCLPTDWIEAANGHGPLRIRSNAADSALFLGASLLIPLVLAVAALRVAASPLAGAPAAGFWVFCLIGLLACPVLAYLMDLSIDKVGGGSYRGPMRYDERGGWRADLGNRLRSNLLDPLIGHVLTISPDTDTSRWKAVVAHELGHLAEHANSRIEVLEASFLQSRAYDVRVLASLQRLRLNKLIGRIYPRPRKPHWILQGILIFSNFRWEGGFFNWYVGLDNGKFGTFEVLTMGLEAIFFGHEDWFEDADPDHRDFVLGLLARV